MQFFMKNKRKKNRDLHKEALQLRTRAGLEEAIDVSKVGVGHPEHEQMELPQTMQVALRYSLGCGRNILQGKATEYKQLSIEAVKCAERKWHRRLSKPGGQCCRG